MSKRKPKKSRQPQTPLPRAENLPAVSLTPATTRHISLDTLRAQVGVYFQESAWEKVAELSRFPLGDIEESDRAEAQVWRLQIRAWGLCKLHTGANRELPAADRKALKEVLAELADTAPDFHRMGAEFELYIDTLDSDAAACAQALPHLLALCREEHTLRWLCALREACRHLLPQSPRTGCAEKPHALEIAAAVKEIYSAAIANDALPAEVRRAMQVLDVELDALVRGKAARRQAVHALQGIPTPSMAEIVAYNSSLGLGSRTHLTPREWAFLLELGFFGYDREATFASYLATAQQYSEPFANDCCEALRTIILAMNAPGDDADNAIVRSLDSLLEALADGQHYFLGDSVLVLGEEGFSDIHLGMTTLFQPSQVCSLLSQVSEMDYGQHRYAEVGAASRILGQLEYDGPLEGEEQAGLDMPGLAWVCSRSLGLQFAASVILQDEFGRACMLLDGLRRYVEGDFPASPATSLKLPFGYHFEGYSFEGLTLPQAQLLRSYVERLAPCRPGMDDDTLSLWRTIAGSIFRALAVIDGETRPQTLQLARTFEADLLSEGQAFWLGYLEQVAGDPVRALHYYLIELDDAEQLPDSALKNARLLFARADDPTVVQEFADLLKGAAPTSSNADEVRKLLKAAQARHAVLDKQSQFEQTAKQRWPSLTMPAKKLLGVLTVIKGFSGYAELGEYAGMSAEWAERHFKKLDDTGMIFKTGTGYRINPHIREFAERENLHAVIGRIVRSEGTSAMKQVFNSQREYTIYQCMVQLCPNHLVFPNSSLQSIMSYEKLKPLIPDDEFGYYLRASVDLVVVNSTNYLPMLAFEIDSPWHDTDKQQERDEKKDRIFAAAGIPFMRLRPVGSPSEATIRAQVAEHLDELVRTLRTDLPGYDQTRSFLEGLSSGSPAPAPT